MGRQRRGAETVSVGGFLKCVHGNSLSFNGRENDPNIRGGTSAKTTLSTQRLTKREYD
jgi:hypothetical protein